MAMGSWPTGEGGETDRILLTGLTFYGYHGVHPEERALGQRFVVDLALDFDLRPAGESDDLAKTASYSEVYRVVREVVEGPPRNLLEAVAEGIARAVLRASGARGIRVRVAKPWAPIKGSAAGTAAVEIYRRS
jgi:7,8-dihydroneopterin aldolase/epimerase/oxygenase